VGNGEGEQTASGIEFVVGEKHYNVSASKEVIISAGPIHTPSILELSGKNVH
jgi:choline dehydrogenase-like flavoprotein